MISRAALAPMRRLGRCQDACRNHRGTGREWGFVARPVEDRAHGEELVERQFAVENVAAGEAVGGLEILRRDDLHGLDEIREIRRVD